MIAIGSAQESDTSKALPKAVECLSYSRRAARVDVAVDIAVGAAVGAAVGVGVAAADREGGYLISGKTERQCLKTTQQRRSDYEEPPRRKKD